MPTRTRNWSDRGSNPVSVTIKVLTWIVVAVIVVGILLTWGDANTGNTIVSHLLDWGRWLVTPLKDVFTNSDPKHELYENWILAAVIYWAIGSLLAWLTRW